MARFGFATVALAALVLLCATTGASAARQISSSDASLSSGSFRQLAAYDIPDEDDDVLLSAPSPPPSPIVFAMLDDGFGLLPSPSPESATDETDSGDEEESPVGVVDDLEETEGAPAPAPAPEAEPSPSIELPTDYVPAPMLEGLSGIELTSTGDDYYRILRFTGSSHQIDAVYVNGIAAELDDSQVPPGWVLQNSEGLNLSTPIALDLYDEEENKVYVPLDSLDSQNLYANFGGEVEGAPEDGRGYYVVYEE